MSKQSQSDQKWASVRQNMDDFATKAEQTSQSAKALRELNINQNQEAAIKLISQRACDQIGQLMASLIEDALILILAGQHPNLSPSIMPSKPNSSPPT